jgi:hypothetical protein
MLYYNYYQLDAVTLAVVGSVSMLCAVCIAGTIPTVDHVVA